VIVANFIAGVLVGSLLGLAISPLLRAWMTWRAIEEMRQDDRAFARDEPTRVER
jgi:hypothetical protein